MTFPLKAVCALLLGALYSLSYPSFLGDGFFIFLFPSLLAFWWLYFNLIQFKQKLLLIIIFNLGLNVCGYYWIAHTLEEFGQLPTPLAYLFSLLTALILQPHLYLFWLIEVTLKKFISYQDINSKLMWLLAGIITVLEYFTPQLFPSFVGAPWLHLSPYLGLAPYGGVILYSLFTYFLIFILIFRIKSKTLPLEEVFVLIAFIALNFYLSPTLPINQINNFNVRIVQANIGNFLKLESESGEFNSVEQVKRDYETLSLKQTKLEKIDLIIWPETAYPTPFKGKEDVLDDYFYHLLTQTSSEFILGGYQLNNVPRSEYWRGYEYNAAIHLSPAGDIKNIYLKNILIPFGETLPFGSLNQIITRYIPTISLFARGEGTPLMLTQDNWRFVTPICYEILKPDFMRKLLNSYSGPTHFLVNLTNDSWFGDSAEQRQHLFLAHWRALEFNLPLIRSTNTGISSVLYPDGSQSEQLKWGEFNNLDISLSLDRKQFPTFFQKWGLSFSFLFWLALFPLILIDLKRNRL